MDLALVSLLLTLNKYLQTGNPSLFPGKQNNHSGKEKNIMESYPDIYS